MTTYYQKLVNAVELVRVPHVVLRRRHHWGQSPQLAPATTTTSEASEVAGFLEVGDRLVFKSGVEPLGPGKPIRVEVYPHDGRKVGNARNCAWICWPGETAAHEMFAIEDFLE